MDGIKYVASHINRLHFKELKRSKTEVVVALLRITSGYDECLIARRISLFYNRKFQTKISFV